MNIRLKKNQMNNLIKNAKKQWLNTQISKPKKNNITTQYYKFIRQSPVVQFKNTPNLTKFLVKFGLRKSDVPYIQVPLKRNFYIMNAEPFKLENGPGLIGTPHMVRATGFYVNNKNGIGFRRLGLVNKALMNALLRRIKAVNVISKAAHQALNRPVFVKNNGTFNTNRVATRIAKSGKRVPVHFVGSRARKGLANFLRGN